MLTAHFAKVSALGLAVMWGIGIQTKIAFIVIIDQDVSNPIKEGLYAVYLVLSKVFLVRL